MSDILKVVGLDEKGYGMIPKMVMQDQRLTRDAKCIYAYFKSFAGAGKTAFPSVKTICNDLKFGCYDTYKKHFDLLTRYGYVTIERVRNAGKFSHNVYTMPQTLDMTYFQPLPNSSVSVESVSENQGTKNNIVYNNSSSSKKLSTALEDYNISWEVYTYCLEQTTRLKKPQQYLETMLEQNKNLRTIEEVKEREKEFRKNNTKKRTYNKNKFHNFKERNTDYEALEKQLRENQRKDKSE